MIKVEPGMSPKVFDETFSFMNNLCFSFLLPKQPLLSPLEKRISISICVAVNSI
jgi:hypothetical protein